MIDYSGRDIEVGDLVIYIDGRYGYKNSHLSTGVVTKVNKATLKVKTMTVDPYDKEYKEIVGEITLKPPEAEEHIVIFRGEEIDHFGYRTEYKKLSK